MQAGEQLPLPLDSDAASNRRHAPKPVDVMHRNNDSPKDDRLRPGVLNLHRLSVAPGKRNLPWQSVAAVT